MFLRDGASPILINLKERIFGGTGLMAKLSKTDPKIRIFKMMGHNQSTRRRGHLEGPGLATPGTRTLKDTIGPSGPQTASLIGQSWYSWFRYSANTPLEWLKDISKVSTANLCYIVIRIQSYSQTLICNILFGTWGMLGRAIRKSEAAQSYFPLWPPFPPLSHRFAEIIGLLL